MRDRRPEEWFNAEIADQGSDTNGCGPSMEERGKNKSGEDDTRVSPSKFSISHLSLPKTKYDPFVAGAHKILSSPLCTI